MPRTNLGKQRRRWRNRKWCHGYAAEGLNGTWEALKNGKRYTLSCSSAEIFVDDYSSQQRRAIIEGSVRPKQGRHGGQVYVQVLPDPCAVTPHGLQGLTAETLIIHPNVNYAHEYTTIECYFMALSRLCSSGLDSPGKEETLRAISRPTSHLGPQMISLSLVDYI